MSVIAGNNKSSVVQLGFERCELRRQECLKDLKELTQILGWLKWQNFLGENNAAVAGNVALRSLNVLGSEYGLARGCLVDAFVYNYFSVSSLIGNFNQNSLVFSRFMFIGLGCSIVS